MKELFKKVVAIVLFSALFIALFQNVNVKIAEAAVIYISVEEYSETVANEINLAAVNGSYGESLKAVGIIREGEFSSYSMNITRGDALVILNRADEFLNGEVVKTELIQQVIDKRISDIGKVAEGKRVDVAKAYLKGFMKGYSNGAYCTDRELKVTNKITKDGALSCIAMLKDKSKRAKISPDGQLIRTKNLPIMAKKYPYILESFPNEYYDWKFSFEGKSWMDPETGVKTPYENIKEYASPVDIDKISDFENFKEVRERNLEEWASKVRTYLECVFNVDYKTINDEWVEKIMSADYTFGSENYSQQTKDELQRYVVSMKENKTIVESSKIAVDGSTLYFYKGRYYFRTYVKYRIVSSNIKKNVNVDTLLQKKPFNAILFTRDPLVDFKNFSVGTWRNGYFDVDLSRYSLSQGENLGVFFAYLNDNYNGERRVQ